MPLRPPQIWEPETTISMSFQAMPASASASLMASEAMLVQDFSGNLPQGCSPTPMMAMSSTVTPS